MLRLVKTSAEGEGETTDVTEINRPGDLRDIATLGLSLSEAKQLLRSFNGKSWPLRPEPMRLSVRIAHAAEVLGT
jgi:hypothetical protein